MLIGKIARFAPPAAVALLLASLSHSAEGGGTLRIAMTASDVPTTTGSPDNGFEGLRFFGFPVFEGLVLWDLTRDDTPAVIRPGLAESWEQDENDRTKWIFHLRKGVKFHDGSDFNADAAIWNLDRYFKSDSPQFDPTGGAIARGRNGRIGIVSGRNSESGAVKDAIGECARAGGTECAVLAIGTFLVTPK